MSDSITPIDLVRHMLTAGTVTEWAVFVPLCLIVAFVVAAIGQVVVESVLDIVAIVRGWMWCRRECGVGDFAIYTCDRRACPGSAAADANRAQFA